MGADQPPTASAEQPRLLGGRYRLGPRLGSGGVSDVYSAVDLQLARPVAVKLFRSPADEVATQRMECEAILLAGLSHPGLLPVHDFDLHGGRPYLVMQLVEGPTLRQRINDGPLPPPVVAQLGSRLADTLAYLHDNGVIHRDLKPANVLLDRTGRGYLTDFGIARAAGAAHLTATGEFVGTAGYLAPEQMTDPNAGPAVDIYALGLVLLECLTGKPEYTGTEVEAALARLSRQPRIPEWLSPAWRDVLTAMTTRDRDHRPTARQCAARLGALAAPAPPTATWTRPPAEPRPRRRLRSLSTATAAAALAAVAVTGLGPSATTIPGQPHPAAAPRPTQQEAQPPPPPPPAPPQGGAQPAATGPTSANQGPVDTPAKPKKPERSRPGKRKGHG